MSTLTDHSRPKTDLTRDVLDLAAAAGHTLSVSAARRLAQKIRRGDFDPTLANLLTYADPTGDTAARNIDTARAA